MKVLSMPANHAAWRALVGHGIEEKVLKHLRARLAEKLNINLAPGYSCFLTLDLHVRYGVKMCLVDGHDVRIGEVHAMVKRDDGRICIAYTGVILKDDTDLIFTNDYDVPKGEGGYQLALDTLCGGIAYGENEVAASEAVTCLRCIAQR